MGHIPYLIAILATLVALLLRLALAPWLFERAMFMPFIVAILLSAWFGGLRAGITATASSAVAGAFFLLEPRHSFLIESNGDRLQLAVFFIVGIGISVVVESLLASLRRSDMRRIQLERAIADRQQAESALHENERELADFFENASVGLHWVDSEGTILRVNQMELELLGYSRDEYVGHSVWEFHADKNVIHDILQRLTGGETLINYEARLVCKDGTIRHVSINSNALFREGQFVHSRCFTRDITEWIEQQSALRRSEARLRRVFESNVVSMIRWDLDRSLILEANAEFLRMTHYTLEDVAEGRLNFRDLTPPEWTLRNEEGIRTIRETGFAAPYEKEYFRKDGSRVPLIIAGTRFDDSPSEGMSFLIDISESKRLEQELRQRSTELLNADKRKDEFLATLAHELRNPLAPIRNGLQLLRIAGAGGDEADRVRDMMERQLSQMIRLVDDLMDVSRISRGKIELRKEKIPLVEVLNNAFETSRPLIEQMNHGFSVTNPDHSILVEADMTRLAQVFLNLINNAAKYNEPNGNIWIVVGRESDEVVVSVRDSGIGIAGDQLPHIFEMFSQVDCSLEKSQGGLGIGLSLAKELVELHGGHLIAMSDGPGRGSEFKVRLPVVTDHIRSKRNANSENLGHLYTSLRILIVDDNRDSATSLSMLLKRIGHETLTAFDGEEAIQATTEFQPEVILLDIGLPKLNGYEVCRRIRNQSPGHEVAIIAQTGWGQEEDRKRTSDAGFDHHMVKPLDTAALLKLLAGIKSETVDRHS